MSSNKTVHRAKRTVSSRNTANRSTSAYNNQGYRRNYYTGTSSRYTGRNSNTTGRYGYYSSTYTSYNTSSVARDYSYDRDKYAPARNKRAAQVKSKHGREKEIVQLNMPKTIVSIAVIFTFSLALLCSYAINSSYRGEIAQKQQELAKIVEDNQYLKTSLEDNVDLNKIAREAEKLGLQKPQEYQITEVQVPNESYTVQYDAKINTQDKSVWEFLKGIINK